ncbi:hypothetical protein BGX28_003366 [Mortierella sp. GBA30]|nr:hypothetical protein BGX28_003366 [Mortierella sp. GBA30]
MAPASPNVAKGELAQLHETVTIQQSANKAGPTKLGTVGETAFKVGNQAIAVREGVDMVLGATTKILGESSSNPILNNLIQLSGKLADIGQTVPFLAPAFVVLKFIIDIEKQAREADEKCQDLLERISFMLSHILVLDGIEQKIEPLIQVLQKVQDTLKEAAALIETYRKQGKIVRRLKMSNKENFEAVAAKVTSCSTDLMLSLQIQQTGDLSLLKRAVPRDLEAEQFVKDNGGEDVINNNPVLVEEFAKRMHLAMSDQVMDQMKSNMQDMLHDNQLQIESLIRESSTTNVADMVKALAIQANEHEAARRLKCVQCDKEYMVSANGPEACSFHAAVGNMYGYRCCSQVSPCKSGYHQPEHHSKYPYTTFFPWSYNILGYSDTVDYWLNQQEIDLEKEEGLQLVRVGLLLRWKTWDELITRRLLMVNVGQVRDNVSYYLEFFTAEELEEHRKVVVSTGNRQIFKNAADNETKAYSMAEWILDEESQQFTGIKFTIKVSSCENATVGIVPLDPKNLETPQNQSIEYLSRTEFEIFAPDRPYEFPKTVQLGPILRVECLRDARFFKSRASSGAMPLTLLTAIGLMANNNHMKSNLEHDRFMGLWRGLNTSPLSSPKQVILLSAKAEYRLVGDPEYQPVEHFGLRNDAKFPLVIEPSKAIDIPFEVLVKKPARVRERIFVPVINFAHVSLHRPVRIRITLTDLDGETCTLVQEYVHPTNYLGVFRRQESDLGYFFVDDVDLCARYLVTVSENRAPSETENYVVSFRGTEMPKKLSIEDLNRIVYRAERTGVTEIELGDLGVGQHNKGISWRAWALVDLSCRRVYGFKVMVEQGSLFEEKVSAVLGYAPCPLYGGEGLKTRPSQYAVESNVMPVVQPRHDIVVVEDDTFDNEEPLRPNLGTESGSKSAELPGVRDATITKADQSPASVRDDDRQLIQEAGCVARTTNASSSSSGIDSEHSSRSDAGGADKDLSVESLVAKIAALETRLAAVERQDHLMLRILALEKKAEASTVTTEHSRIEKVEQRLESMDKKLETLNSNMGQLDSNATRLADALEKIATLLTP